jgi:hypothetical protein
MSRDSRTYKIGDEVEFLGVRYIVKYATEFDDRCEVMMTKFGPGDDTEYLMIVRYN